MPEALILSAVRTPIGKYLGSLAELTAPHWDRWRWKRPFDGGKSRLWKSTKS